jgi:hypothetical protein
MRLTCTCLFSPLSDVSYLSRPRARSVAGSFHHLTCMPRTGLPPDPLAFINGPVSCHTNTIPVFCSSVQEAEYAALFAAARLADNERSILHNLGGSVSPPTARSTSSSQWRLECPYVGRLRREARGRLCRTGGQWSQARGGIDKGSVIR